MSEETKMIPFDFGSLLTNDQKRQLLNNRISQFVTEAYQHQLNLKTAESINNEQQIEASTKSIEILTAAINIHQEELAKLPPAESQA